MKNSFLLITLSLFVGLIYGKFIPERDAASINAYVVAEGGNYLIQTGKKPENALAWGYHKVSSNETGWNILEIQGNSSVSDSEMAFGAGFLEGSLCVDAIWNSWMSYVNGTQSNWTTGVQSFMKQQDAWVRYQATASEDREYFDQVSLVLAQLDGLVAGYNQHASAEQQLTYADVLSYQLQWEIGDIQTAVSVSEDERPVLKKEPIGEHCSVLIKLTDDRQHLFASHVTWSGFNTMLRTYKHYDLPYSLSTTQSTLVSFSSYPGAFPSGDDFYRTSQNMIVMETTIAVMNTTLFKSVSTSSVPYWIRIILANRMATSGEEWSQIFAKYNSGTYNNEYMVVDYKQFKAGQTPLAAGSLWVVEQIPGYVISADMSNWVETNGYWASYNIPYFPFVYNISEYPTYYKQFGDMYSWSECARAQIFRRDQSKVQDLDGMKAMMRYNEYQTDPLSLKDACRGISARCDLNVPWVTNSLNGWGPFGGIDCKIYDNQFEELMETTAVSGPSWDSQPPFAWTNEFPYAPHFGQPKLFAFKFEHMKPTLKRF